MKFRTPVKQQAASNQIDHDSKVVLMGSCFSDHMVQKFNYFKFETFANPFGILFNPAAIENAIRKCTQHRHYTEKDLILREDVWLSLDHHSQFNHRNKQAVLSEINEQITQGHHALLNATHLIITLGTSWIYKWHEDGRIVGNCHKIPQRHFNKELLSSEDIIRNLNSMVTHVRGINKEVSIIFTVSPVRHLKDGFIENTLSKALLHTAIHKVKEALDIAYFPSYEIMMDDLRDYRYYERDMMHPNAIAIDYIWELFTSVYVDDASKKVMQEIDEIQKSLNHKPFDPESKAHQKFLLKLAAKIEALSLSNPQIKFNKKGK